MNTKNSTFIPESNRITWLNNWKKVFTIWHWLPGFLFIAEIRKYVPIFIPFSYYRFETQAPELVKNDSLDNFITSTLFYPTKSEVDNKNCQYLNAYYISKSLNFKNNRFFHGKYIWKSSLTNAKTVLENAIEYNSIYELLLNNYFIEDLNLHRSRQSLVNQNPCFEKKHIARLDIKDSNFYKSTKTRQEYFNGLKMAHWDYQIFVMSALCFVLGSLYRENQFRDKDISIQVEHFLIDIIQFFWCDAWCDALLSVFEEINLFYYQPFATLTTLNMLNFGTGLSVFSASDSIKYNKTIIKYCKAFHLDFLTPNSFFESMVLENKKMGKEFMHIFYTYEKFFNMCSVWQKDYGIFKETFLPDTQSNDSMVKSGFFTTLENQEIPAGIKKEIKLWIKKHIFADSDPWIYPSTLNDYFNQISGSSFSNCSEEDKQFHEIVCILLFFGNLVLLINENLVEANNIISEQFDDEVGQVFCLEDELAILLPNIDIWNVLFDKTPFKLLKIRKVIKFIISRFNDFISTHPYQEITNDNSKINILDGLRLGTLVGVTSFGTSFLGTEGLGLKPKIWLDPSPLTGMSASLEPRIGSTGSISTQAMNKQTNPSTAKTKIQKKNELKQAAIAQEITPFTDSREYSKKALEPTHTFLEHQGCISIYKDKATSKEMAFTSSGPYKELKSAIIKRGGAFSASHIAHAFHGPTRSAFDVTTSDGAAVIWQPNLNRLEENKRIIGNCGNYTLDLDTTTYHDSMQIIYEKHANEKLDRLQKLFTDPFEKTQIEAMRRTLPCASEQLDWRRITYRVPDRNSVLSEIIVHGPIIEMKNNVKAGHNLMRLKGSSQKTISLECFIPEMLQLNVNGYVVHARGNSDLMQVAKDASDLYSGKMQGVLQNQQDIVMDLLFKAHTLQEDGYIETLIVPKTILTIGNKQLGEYEVLLPKLINPTREEIREYSNTTIPNIFTEAKQIACGLTEEDMLKLAQDNNIGNFTKRSKHPLLVLKNKPHYSLDSNVWSSANPLARTPTVSRILNISNDNTENFL